MHLIRPFDLRTPRGWLTVVVLLGGLSWSGAAPAADAEPRAERPRAIPPLVTRNHPKLTLAGARRLILAADTKAAELKVAENIAVVDAGGHLIAFARMDGARPASVQTALTKAMAAATTLHPTGPLGKPPAGEPDLLLNLSLQNASGGRMTALLGGLPVVVDGEVIGAIGVGGGTGAEDKQVAQAGLDALKSLLDGSAR